MLLFVKRGVRCEGRLGPFEREDEVCHFLWIEEYRELICVPWCSLVLGFKFSNRELPFFFYLWCSFCIHIAFQSCVFMF